MKKTITFIACMLFCMASFAQQALWGRSNVVSPEIHDNNTVTFRLSAPKAVKVQLTGDFLPQGVADLKEGKDGVWEFTTPEPLASELYSYAFIVDGLRMLDPSNVFLNRDVNTVVNIFIIGGGQGDLYQVNNVPHGTVSKVWYDSKVLEKRRRMTVYTPAGYETSGKRYPVFYLLHGSGGDEEAWMDLGRTAQILDNLIAQGKAKPMIVVMTNGNGGREATPSQASGGMKQPDNRTARGKAGAFEESFPEIVNYIDKHYRTIKKKSGRAIAGLSMGGGHTLQISKEYPDMFDYVGLFSSSIRLNSNANSASPVYENILGKLKIQFAKNPKLYWIAIGKDDFLYKANAEFRKVLDENGLKYEYFENGDGHIWRNWRIYLSMFAPRLF
ncbi:MAG: esterase [Bacteroides sp.]|nr:esterase [Bacteroides sp.]